MPARCFLFACLVVGCRPADPPAPLAWRSVNHLPEARSKAASVTLGKYIYFLGGLTGENGTDPALSQKVSDRVDRLEVASGTWSVGPPLPAECPKHHLAVTTVGGKIYILGGYVGSHADVGGIRTAASTWVLDDAGWRRLADQPIARSGAAAQAIGTKIYVAGGGTDELSGVTDLYAYDPAADRWVQLRSMTAPRSHVASCALGGRLVVAGGWTKNGSDVSTSAAAEMYDPASDTWESLPDMPTARGSAGSAVIGDTCFVIGGFRWSPPMAFAVTEGFSSASRTWSTFAPLTSPRQAMGTTAFGDSIYALGGSPQPGDGYVDFVDVLSR
jgi:serine/threonine-protein kinase PknK